MTDFTLAPDELLDAAREVLVDAGFVAEHANLPHGDSSWLLAENDFFAVGLISRPSVDELAVANAIGTTAMLDRLGGKQAGAKRWDAYLVLLTTEPEETIDSRQRVQLIYNMRGLRRLLGVGLRPDDDSVRRVLAPFLPLSEPLEDSLGDIGTELVDALVVNGIASDAAARYVAAFTSTGSLEGV